jgi:hypothetical protein
MSTEVKLLIISIIFALVVGGAIWIVEKIELSIYNHRQRQQKAYSRKISNSKNR